MSELDYLTGFGNEFESEALPGALPRGRFTPQNPPLGLYPEKFSNTAFTAPAAQNRRTWFYRIRPSVLQGPWESCDLPLAQSAPLPGVTPPEPLRWDPPEPAVGDGDFVDGLVTVVANGDPAQQLGMAAHIYACNTPMSARCCAFNDGELLIVPWRGGLRLRTECGNLDVRPGHIALVPRGMKFAVDPTDNEARGYICENYGAFLRLPERGPIGSDALANARDFEAPVAAFADSDAPVELVTKFLGHWFRTTVDHDPLDVVAWVGNAVPYRYDLHRFNVLGSVSYDHPDPSLYTVLTAPSDTAGVANVDFVVFAPRWLVAEDTFRPPWFHRNVMSEFMGLIEGQYDAKKSGFTPGGMSLHNMLVPHGPDHDVVAAASSATLSPQKLDNTLAFMFETRYPLAVSEWALTSPARQADYRECWQSIASRFEAP